MKSKVEPYNGTKVLCLNPDAGKYAVRFGMSKCKLIVECIEEIREHVRIFEEKRGSARSALPGLTIGEHTDYPLELSMNKCERIMEHQSEIRMFVNNEGKE